MEVLGTGSISIQTTSESSALLQEKEEEVERIGLGVLVQQHVNIALDPTATLGVCEMDPTLGTSEIAS